MSTHAITNQSLQTLMLLRTSSCGVEKVLCAELVASPFRGVAGCNLGHRRPPAPRGLAWFQARLTTRLAYVRGSKAWEGRPR